MTPGTQSKELVRGALILTVGALVTKLLSAAYRIPFQNIVGDVGFYIYQQVYPFYGLVLVLSTYGFPVVISKLYAEQKQLGDAEGARRLLLICLFFLSLFGLCIFFALYTGSEWIAGQMNDPHLAPLLRIIAISFLLFPFVSVFRGYFQGRGDMVPTAVSQVGEQLVRVSTILVLAVLFMHKGLSLYYVGGGAVFGSLTGGVISVMILAGFIRLQNKSKHYPIWSLFGSFEKAETKRIVKILFLQGFAISVSGMLLIFLQMADSFNLYTLLVSAGIDEEKAKQLKGIYDRGQPLVQLGTIVATSMSLTLVPLITSEKIKKKIDFLVDKIRLAMQVSIIIGVAGSLGLLSIIKPANIMLFENTAGSDVLALLSLTILFGSISITLSSILQGLGNALYPAVIILIGFGIKYIINMALVPYIETAGAAAASVIAMLLMMLLLMIKLRIVLKTPLLSFHFLVTIVLAAGLMVIALFGYLKLTDILYFYIKADRIAAAIQAVSAVIIGGFIYLLVIFRGGIFTEEELSLLPFGSKLLILLPNRNRRRNI